MENSTNSTVEVVVAFTGKSGRRLPEGRVRLVTLDIKGATLTDEIIAGSAYDLDSLIAPYGLTARGWSRTPNACYAVADTAKAAL